MEKNIRNFLSFLSFFVFAILLSKTPLDKHRLRLLRYECDVQYQQRSKSTNLCTFLPTTCSSRLRQTSSRWNHQFKSTTRIEYFASRKSRTMIVMMRISMDIIICIFFTKRIISRPNRRENRLKTRIDMVLYVWTIAQSTKNISAGCFLRMDGNGKVQKINVCYFFTKHRVIPHPTKQKFHRHQVK